MLYKVSAKRCIWYRQNTRRDQEDLQYCGKLEWLYGFDVGVYVSSIYISSLFGVALQNDFTPEEEEEVRKENQWAFE